MRAPVLALLVLLLLPAGAAARAKPGAQPPATGAPAAPAGGRWIVVYKRAAVDNVDRETDARERRRGFHSRLRFRRAIEGFAARLSAEQVRALRADPDVDAVVPDRPVHARAFQPLAPGEPLPPTGVRRIGAGGVDFVRGAASTSVAVLDTGIDLKHPDLNAEDGKDCVTEDTPADDDDGHGTHVAGIIGALNDGSGVTGVAPGTRVQAVKVLNNVGQGSDSQLICGIDWVIEKRAERNIRVMNMSLGGAFDHNRNCGHASADPTSSLVDAVHNAICRAAGVGLLSVVAAGNQQRNLSDPDLGTPPGYDVPASYPEVLTVTAMTDFDGMPGRLVQPEPPCAPADGIDDTRARYSNYTLTNEAEASHTVAAPGTCIRSTWPLDLDSETNPKLGYNTQSGTSMATPHAAAVAALCVGEAGSDGPCAGMSPAQIVQRVRADAETFRSARPAGFEGDPVDAIGTQFFGFLIRAPGPETSFTSVPPDTTENPSPSFAFASPGAVGFECSVDGAPWVACVSPHTTGELPDGAHQFSVRAVDRAGTPDLSPAVDGFTVDRPDPPPPPPPPDTTAPLVSYSLASRQRIAKVVADGIRVSVACSEPCRLETSVVVAGKEAVRLGISRTRTDVTAGRRAAGLGSVRRVLTIKLTSAVRRRLARNRTALVQVRIVATDAAGNARTVKKSVRLLR